MILFCFSIGFQNVHGVILFCFSIGFGGCSDGVILFFFSIGFRTVLMV